MSEQRGGTPFLFLSHAAADTDAARKLKQRLEAAPAGREPCLRAGETSQAQLEEVLGRHATAFAVYIGSKGVVNWVEAEVRCQVARDKQQGLFPVYSDSLLMERMARTCSPALPTVSNGAMIAADAPRKSDILRCVLHAASNAIRST
jgi:hypothetical protein